MNPIILLIITLLCWGSTPILEKIGLKGSSPLIGVTIRSIAATIGLVMLVIITGKGKELFAANGKDISMFAMSGLLTGLIGMVTYFELLKGSEISTIVPIAAAYPLVTAILSYIILKEDVTFTKIIGTVLIVAGIWLVKTKG